MTPQGRTVVAIVALVCAIALAITGTIAQDGGSALTAGVALAGPVLGYVFGDRNGEKRTANALAERGLDADSLNRITDAIRDTHAGDPVQAA